MKSESGISDKKWRTSADADDWDCAWWYNYAEIHHDVDRLRVEVDGWLAFDLKL